MGGFKDGFELVDLVLALGKIELETPEGKRLISNLEGVFGTLNRREDLGSDYAPMIANRIKELNKFLLKLAK